MPPSCPVFCNIVLPWEIGQGCTKEGKQWGDSHNIWGTVGLVTSVDQKQETRIEGYLCLHLLQYTSAAQVGPHAKDNTLLVVSIIHSCMYLYLSMKSLTIYFSLQVKNKP
jgi:hypothetical protein